MKSLLDYGPIDLTGAGDSTAIVQTAVDNCGGLLEWPGGKVRTISPIRITKPVRIIGPGTDERRLGEGAAQIYIDSIIHHAFLVDSHNVGLDGLTITGPTSRQTPGGGMGVLVGSLSPLGHTVRGFKMTHCSVHYHGVAVQLLRASNWKIDGCLFNGYTALYSANLNNIDEGDSLLANSDLRGPGMGSGQCLYYTGGGSLRVANNKFLDSRDAIYIEWLQGTSGGPVMVGNSVENYSRRGIYAVGAPGCRLINWVITGNQFAGGDPIFVEDSLELDRLMVSGNVLASSSHGCILVNIGAQTRNWLVVGNVMDGCGAPGSIGVYVRPGSFNGYHLTNLFCGLWKQQGP